MGLDKNYDLPFNDIGYKPLSMYSFSSSYGTDSLYVNSWEKPHLFLFASILNTYDVFSVAKFDLYKYNSFLYLPKLDFNYSNINYAPNDSKYTYNFGELTSFKKSTSYNTGNNDKNFLKDFVRTSDVSLNNIPPSFKSQNGVKEITLSDGRKVLACRWSRFDNIQNEWANALKCFEQAAADFGCDVVYSDVERTVAESNIGRAKKGNLVAKGGHSPHNYGVAADFVLFKDGKILDQYSSLYKQIIDKAIALSGNKIESGIYWNKKGERHHIELRDWELKYKKSNCLIA